MAADQDQRIAEVVARERSRLRSFIRRRVADPDEAEDILQDVFYRLLEVNRLLMPVEHVTSWLFRVARNRIIDVFRKKRPESFSDLQSEGNEEDVSSFEEMLASRDAGPETLYASGEIGDALEAALAELPAEQREVFIAHEFEGRSFADIAGRTGESVNTLLARKRYAVLHLRKRLQKFYDDL